MLIIYSPICERFGIGHILKTGDDMCLKFCRCAIAEKRSRQYMFFFSAETSWLSPFSTKR